MWKYEKKLEYLTTTFSQHFCFFETSLPIFQNKNSRFFILIKTPPNILFAKTFIFLQKKEAYFASS